MTNRIALKGITTSESAQAVLDLLTEGLAIGCGRKVDNAKGAFMPVHVDRLTNNLYSVAHYYEQNGDLVSDPRMVFMVDEDGYWWPVSIEMGGLGVYREAIIWRDGQMLTSKSERKDQQRFASTWMRNIKTQQKIKVAKRAA